MPRHRNLGRLSHGAVRLVGATVATLATVLLLASPASAHLALIDTDPDNGAVLSAAPAEVRLTFNEPVRLPSGGIQLSDAAGQDLAATGRVEADEVRVELPPGLGQGSYLLSWRIVAEDGHPLSGSLSFSVGAPSDTVAAPESTTWDPAGATEGLRSLSQGLYYIALLLATGLVAFSVMLPRAAPALLRGRLAKVIGVAAVTAALAGLALVPLSGAVKLGGGLAALGSAAVWDPDIVGSEWIAALLLLAGLGILIATHGRGQLARRGGGWLALPLVGATCALVAPSLVGHTRSFGPEPLLILSDFTHLMAGAVWIGGLVGLALTLRALSTHDGLAEQVLSRVSAAAAASLALLVAMGSLLSWRILASWDLLFNTTYGVLLLSKVGIVAAAVAVAMVNRFVLLPRIRRSASDRSTRPTRLIRRAIAGEALMIATALVLTGFLANQSPHLPTPATATPDSVSPTKTVGEVRVVVTMRSDHVGSEHTEARDTGTDPLTDDHTDSPGAGHHSEDAGAPSSGPHAH